MAPKTMLTFVFGCKVAILEFSGIYLVGKGYRRFSTYNYGRCSELLYTLAQLQNYDENSGSRTLADLAEAYPRHDEGSP
jgi:hypothetical protein